MEANDSIWDGERREFDITYPIFYPLCLSLNFCYFVCVDLITTFLVYFPNKPVYSYASEYSGSPLQTQN